VGELLHLALQSQGYRRTHVLPTSPSCYQSTYHGSVFLPRAQAWVGVAWRCRASGQAVQL
jgi:hypothetical protein